jgi:hypothetical protein
MAPTVSQCSQIVVESYRATLASPWYRLDIAILEILSGAVRATRPILPWILTLVKIHLDRVDTDQRSRASVEIGAAI